MNWNLGSLRRDHGRFLAAHSAMVGGVLYDVGNVAVAEVALHPGFTPRSGDLQKATKPRVVRTRNGRILRVANAKPYARAIEEGSKPHKIAARVGKALRFIGSGGIVFRRAVNHPGNKPYWFLRSAMGVAGTRAESMLHAGMQRVSRSSFGR